MAGRYHVLWAEAAEEDLMRIIRYIAADGPHNAMTMLRHLKAKASSLHTLPERGRIVPELRDQGITQYRELVVSPWRILYRISERGVYVLAVFDSRRNVEDVLLQRLTETS
jgi:toxin ParE1/3/4